MAKLLLCRARSAKLSAWAVAQKEPKVVQGLKLCRDSPADVSTETGAHGSTCWHRSLRESMPTCSTICLPYTDPELPNKWNRSGQHLQLCCALKHCLLMLKLLSHSLTTSGVPMTTSKFAHPRSIAGQGLPALRSTEPANVSIPPSIKMWGIKLTT